MLHQCKRSRAAPCLHDIAVLQATKDNCFFIYTHSCDSSAGGLCSELAGGCCAQNLRGCRGESARKNILLPPEMLEAEMRLGVSTWFGNEHVGVFVRALARCCWWFYNNYGRCFGWYQALGTHVGMQKPEKKSSQVTRGEGATRCSPSLRI